MQQSSQTSWQGQERLLACASECLVGGSTYFDINKPLDYRINTGHFTGHLVSDFFILESRELGVTKHSQIPTFLCLHSPRNPQLMCFNKYIISQIYGCYIPAGQTDIHGIKKGLTETMKNWKERKLVGLDSLSFSKSWLNNGNSVLPQREAEIWGAIMQATRAPPFPAKTGTLKFCWAQIWSNPFLKHGLGNLAKDSGWASLCLWHAWAQRAIKMLPLSHRHWATEVRWKWSLALQNGTSFFHGDHCFERSS